MYSPGESVQHSSGATGQITGQNQQTGKAEVKWFNKDAQGNPITGDENGQQHTIRANDPQNAGTAVARWAEAVANDVRYGTDVTKIGGVLKAMGAHGVDVSNSSAVGDWMASIPLGLLKIVKGAGEAEGSRSAGGNWQAAKDLAGGVGQTATMPTAVIAPESSELETLAGQVVDHAAGAISDATNAASDAAKASVNAVNKVADTIATKISPKLPRVVPERLADVADNFEHTVEPIYDQAHQALKDAVSNVAQSEDVAVKPSSSSLRDVAGDVSDAIDAKADQGFKVIDNALEKSGLPGKFQQISKDLKTLNQKFNDAIGDDNLQATLATKIQAREADLETAAAHLKNAGIPQEFVDSTVNTFKKARALDDLQKLVNTRGVIDGTRPEMANANSIPERLNLPGFEKGLNDLYNNSKFGGRRLQQALGDEASTLLTKAGDARANLAKATQDEAQRVIDRATQSQTVNKLADAADTKRKWISRLIKGGVYGTVGDKLTGGHAGHTLGSVMENIF
jgi:hypothetical protein